MKLPCRTGNCTRRGAAQDRAPRVEGRSQAPAFEAAEGPGLARRWHHGSLRSAGGDRLSISLVHVQIRISNHVHRGCVIDVSTDRLQLLEWSGI
jgi:hypothetical protein